MGRRRAAFAIDAIHTYLLMYSYDHDGLPYLLPSPLYKYYVVVTGQQRRAPISPWCHGHPANPPGPAVKYNSMDGLARVHGWMFGSSWHRFQPDANEPTASMTPPTPPLCLPMASTTYYSRSTTDRQAVMLDSSIYEVRCSFAGSAGKQPRMVPSATTRAMFQLRGHGFSLYYPYPMRARLRSTR